MIHALALAAAVASAPCSAPEYHQWDFWLGSWTVTDPAGVVQGTSEVHPAPSGCGFIEQWRGADGAQGTSFNAYDPVRMTWTQFWAGSGTVIGFEGRLETDGAIHTEGEIAYYQGASKAQFRGVWTPLPDGAVRQEFWQLDSHTGKWTNWFTGIYRHRS